MGKLFPILTLALATGSLAHARTCSIEALEKKLEETCKTLQSQVVDLNRRDVLLKLGLYDNCGMNSVSLYRDTKDLNFIFVPFKPHHTGKPARKVTNLEGSVPVAAFLEKKSKGDRTPVMEERRSIDPTRSIKREFRFRQCRTLLGDAVIVAGSLGHLPGYGLTSPDGFEVEHKTLESTEFQEFVKAAESYDPRIARLAHNFARLLARSSAAGLSRVYGFNESSMNQLLLRKAGDISISVTSPLNPEEFIFKILVGFFDAASYAALYSLDFRGENRGAGPKADAGGAPAHSFGATTERFEVLERKMGELEAGMAKLREEASKSASFELDLKYVKLDERSLAILAAVLAALSLLVALLRRG